MFPLTRLSFLSVNAAARRSLGNVRHISSQRQHRKDRTELAGLHQILYRQGMSEGICNHLSLMSHDGDREVMLITPYGHLWREVCASSLAAVAEADLNLTAREIVELPALTIHWALHKARPDARAIIHVHSPYATAMASLEDPRLPMCHQNAMRYFDDVAYDIDYGGVSTDVCEGERISKQLGPRCSVLVMQNHGVTVVGRSVAIAFDRFYYFERSCQNYMLARATGMPLSDVSSTWNRQQLREFREYCLDYEKISAPKHFEAELRMLRREDSDFEA